MFWSNTLEGSHNSCASLYGNFSIVHLLNMNFRPFLTVFVIVFSFPFISVGQSQQVKNYLLQLKATNIDTFLIVKSGYTGSEVKYNDTSKAISNGQTIYILSQHQGHFKLVSFDDFNRQKSYSVDSCSLFSTIVQNKSILRQKEAFYRKRHEELKKAKFLPPKPIHYSYVDVTLKLASFDYEAILLENNFNDFEYPEEKENWFIVTKTIVNEFFSLLKSAQG